MSWCLGWFFELRDLTLVENAPSEIKKHDIEIHRDVYIDGWVSAVRGKYVPTLGRTDETDSEPDTADP